MHDHPCALVFPHCVWSVVGFKCLFLKIFYCCVMRKSKKVLQVYSWCRTTQSKRHWRSAWSFCTSWWSKSLEFIYFCLDIWLIQLPNILILYRFYNLHNLKCNCACEGTPIFLYIFRLNLKSYSWSSWFEANVCYVAAWYATRREWEPTWQGALSQPKELKLVIMVVLSVTCNIYAYVCCTASFCWRNTWGSRSKS